MAKRMKAYIAVLNTEDGKIYMLPTDRLKSEGDIEEALQDAGFSLNDIEWMLCDGKVNFGWRGFRS